MSKSPKRILVAISSFCAALGILLTAFPWAKKAFLSPPAPIPESRAEIPETVPVPPSPVPPVLPPGVPDTRLTPSHLRFLPVTIQGVIAPLVRVEAIYHEGVLKLYDTDRKSALWTGPIQRAAFTVETHAGHIALTESDSGKLLWRGSLPQPAHDLRLVQSPDGKAALYDKNGKRIWAGNAPRQRSGNRVISGNRRGTLSLETSQVRLAQQNGAIRLTRLGESKTLWEGRATPNLALLVQSGATDTLLSRNKVASATVLPPDTRTETRTTLRFTRELGTVLIASRTKKFQQRQRVDVVRVRRSPALPGMPDSRTHTQMPALKKAGMLLLDYRDSRQQPVLRLSVFRGGVSRGYQTW